MNENQASARPDKKDLSGNSSRYESCTEWFLVLDRLDSLNSATEFPADKKTKLDKWSGGLRERGERAYFPKRSV